MLEQICAFIHNYFDKDSHGKPWHVEAGAFAIAEGTISLPFLVEGQYFRICGSRLNDGVYKYPATDLRDETFTGEIREMRAPAAVLALTAEIETWMTKYGEAVNSPYASESFGGYSYTKAQGGASEDGGSPASSWQAVFGPRLNQWRKLA